LNQDSAVKTAERSSEAEPWSSKGVRLCNFNVIFTLWHLVAIKVRLPSH